MQIPRSGQETTESRYFVIAEDVGRLVEQVVPLIDAAVGIEWYERPAEVDRAALALCRLRRAGSGEKGGPRHGDAAVRAVLSEVDTPALVWLASRAISFMDESGYPEVAERWFPDDNPVDT
jgi:hypothetical protein